MYRQRREWWFAELGSRTRPARSVWAEGDYPFDQLEEEESRVAPGIPSGSPVASGDLPEIAR